jgi:hypothetical protein
MDILLTFKEQYKLLFIIAFTFLYLAVEEPIVPANDRLTRSRKRPFAVDNAF